MRHHSQPEKVGQKNKLTYRWARKGSRPVSPTIKGPKRPTCSVRSAPNAEPAPPSCRRPATLKLCSFISMRSQPKSLRALAILLLDQAGWHGAKALKVPSNISLLPLPPRAPELNGQENIWQFMRQNWLSNRIFKSFDSITAATPGTRSSISRGKSCPSRAAIGQPQVTQSEDWYKSTDPPYGKGGVVRPPYPD